MIPMSPKLVKLTLMTIFFICGSIFILLIATSSIGSAVKGIYLLQIGDTHNSTSGFTVRVGYFGLCEGTAGNLQCSKAGALIAHLGGQPAAHRPYLDFGLRMQRDIFFPWIMGTAGILFFVGSFCLFPKEISVGPRPWLQKIVDVSLGLSITLTFIAAVGSNQARNALIIATAVLPTNFVITAGETLYIFHWVFGGIVTMLWILSVGWNPFRILHKTRV